MELFVKWIDNEVCSASLATILPFFAGIMGFDTKEMTRFVRYI